MIPMELVLRVFVLSLLMAFIGSTIGAFRLKKEIFEAEGRSVPASMTPFYNITRSTDYRSLQAIVVLSMLYFAGGTLWLFTFGEQVFPFIVNGGT